MDETAAEYNGRRDMRRSLLCCAAIALAVRDWLADPDPAKCAWTILDSIDLPDLTDGEMRVVELAVSSIMDFFTEAT